MTNVPTQADPLDDRLAELGRASAHGAATGADGREDGVDEADHAAAAPHG